MKLKDRFNDHSKNVKSLINVLKQNDLLRRRMDFHGTHSVTIYPPLKVHSNSSNGIPLDEIIAGQPSDTINAHLYVHFGACEWTCNFCLYERINETTMKKYEDILVEKIIEELVELENIIEDQHKTFKINSFYLGGGTGFLMSCKNVEKLLNVINSMDLSKSYSSCVESSSSSLCRDDSEKKLQLFRENNVKRISIGVQTIDAEILRNSGRGSYKTDTFVSALSGAEAVADHAVEVASRYFNNINIDLMQDLTDNYTVDVMDKDLQWFLKHDIPSLTYYITRYKNGSRNYGISNPIDSTVNSVSMRMAMQDVIADEGYHINPGGRFTKNVPKDVFKNSRSSPEECIVGFGPSAYSRLDSHYVRNVSNIKDWIDSDNNQDNGIESHYYINDFEKGENQVIHMVRNGCQVDYLKQLFMQTSEPRRNLDTFNKLVNLGLLEITDNYCVLSSMGRALEEEVVWQFVNPMFKTTI